MDTVIWNFVDCVDDDEWIGNLGVTDYIMLYYWREFNLAIFYDSPNRQIKVLAKFSRYTVDLKM